MPTRRVYMVRIRGLFDNNPHPHVDLSDDGPTRLVVPCFTCGGDEVDSYILDEKSRTRFTEEEIYVELDNRKCVRWKPGYSGTQSYWLTARARALTETALRFHAGDMDSDSVRQIVKSLIARAERQQSLFSPKGLSMLTDLLAECDKEREQDDR